MLAELAVEEAEAGEVDRALALGLAAVDIDDPPPDAVSKLAIVANGMGTRAVLTGHSGDVRSGDFSPDGRRAVSGGCVQAGDNADVCASGELILWDLESMSEATRWPGHKGWVTSLAWGGEDEIISGGADGSLILWNAASQEALARWDAHDGAINAIAISPDGALAASAGDDGEVVYAEPCPTPNHPSVNGPWRSSVRRGVQPR